MIVFVEGSLLLRNGRLDLQKQKLFLFSEPNTWITHTYAYLYNVKMRTYFYTG